MEFFSCQWRRSVLISSIVPGVFSKLFFVVVIVLVKEDELNSCYELKMQCPAQDDEHQELRQPVGPVQQLVVAALAACSIGAAAASLLA